MKRPWMPLYIADYLRKTTHLGALESGAYLHLIMDYWQNDGLPDDDKKLARIARMTDREWKSAKSTLEAFFHDGWKHERITAEIEETSRLAESNAGKARDAANKRWAKHKSGKQEAELEQSSEHAPSNAPLCTLHTSHSSSLDKSKEAPASEEKQIYDLGKELLGANSGGVIKKLIMAKDGVLPLARAALETSRVKSNPREYIGAIIRSRDGAGDSSGRSF